MEQLPVLTPEEKERYSRHLLLPDVAMVGQQRLKKASVLIVGAGGLGSPAILYLAAAGVGTIGVVDFDCVELSNLQRQVLYTTNDLGEPKSEQATIRAAQLNPAVQLIAHRQRVDVENVLSLVTSYDLVIDGSDNFATRYLINDACVLSNRPNVYGSIYRFEGQSTVFTAGDGPCYRCLFPQPPANDAIPNCAEGGVLGVMAGLIGVIQATEALKLILNLGSTLSGKLLIYDALAMSFQFLKLSRDPACAVCSDTPTIKTIQRTEFSCPGSMDTAEIGREISARQLQQELSSGKRVTLLDVRNQQEFEYCHIQGAIHIPLNELADYASKVDRQADIVVYCKSGVRSSKAVEVLTAQGFSRLRHLAGGILSWVRDVDSSLPGY